MRLELIDSLSLPGNPDRPNEDAFAQTASMAVVLDGVTAISDPLMPGKSDPAWLAQFTARRLAAHSAGGGNPRNWIAAAATDAQKSYNGLRSRGPKERYELPFASFMLAALGDDTLDAFWFGDCAALVKLPDGSVQILGDSIDSRLREREYITGLAAAQGTSAIAALKSGAAKPELRERRNRFNMGKGPWLFAPDGKCARHAATARARVAKGAVVLLASDGFLVPVTDYGKYSVADFIDAAGARGLAAIATDIRAIEAEDPEGVKFPRFKQSDDATALLLRVV